MTPNEQEIKGMIEKHGSFNILRGLGRYFASLSRRDGCKKHPHFLIWRTQARLFMGLADLLEK